MVIASSHVLFFPSGGKVPKGYTALELLFISARTITRHHHHHDYVAQNGFSYVFCLGLKSGILTQMHLERGWSVLSSALEVVYNSETAERSWSIENHKFSMFMVTTCTHH